MPKVFKKTLNATENGQNDEEEAIRWFIKISPIKPLSMEFIHLVNVKIYFIKINASKLTV